MTLGFSKRTTGDEVVAAFQENVEGRTFVITGPSFGGLGAETAKSLAKGHPGQMLLVGRSATKIEPVIHEIRRISPTTSVTLINADFSSLASVREAADQVRKEVKHIDCLINNAAIMACPEAKSQDGFELQLATNYLAHFVLTNALMDLVSVDVGRVVNVSSVGHKFSGINWDDINLEIPGSYKPGVAYAQSKTANILHAVALAERLKPRKITSFSLHPGSVATNLQVHITSVEQRNRLIEEMKQKDPGFNVEDHRKTLQEGCATALRAALDPTLTDRSGCYLEDCESATAAPYAVNKAAAERLWKMTLEMTEQ